MGWFFFFWGLFTLLMFVGTLRINRSLQAVFGTLVILFWLLAIRDWAGGGAAGAGGYAWGRMAGWEGIVCGLSAMYASIAQIWNELYGRVVLPIGPVKK
jgi:succinate-acetate transporter protein